MNSDRYLPSEDAPKQDILISLKELGEKRIPGAPMYKRAAEEIERLRKAFEQYACNCSPGKCDESGCYDSSHCGRNARDNMKPKE